MSADMKQIRVIAVDDHLLLRQGIVGLITDERLFTGIDGAHPL